MASIFLPSQRSRQLRGPNFGNLNSPDSGAPGTPAAAAGGGGGGFGTPTSLFNMGAGAEGAGGSPESGNNNSYGQTDTWGGFLGGLTSPALAGLAMVNNPNALSVGASLYGGKPTSIASKISDAFDQDVVDPNIAAPGKGASDPDMGKADFGADFSGTVSSGGPEGGGKAAGGADPGQNAENNSPEGGKGAEAADGGTKARTGAFLAPPPGGSMEPQPVDVTAHTGEFILRPEISMAIGPEILTAVNSGIIPPEIVAEALMALLEQYDPGYNDQQMPVAGPNGTMMPGNMGGPMGMGGGQPPSVIPMGGQGDMGDGEGNVAGAIETDGFHPGAPAIGGPPSNLPPTADPRQAMKPPAGIPPEEDAPVSPAYRSGGAVIDRSGGPQHQQDWTANRERMNPGYQGKHVMPNVTPALPPYMQQQGGRMDPGLRQQFPMPQVTTPMDVMDAGLPMESGYPSPAYRSGGQVGMPQRSVLRDGGQVRRFDSPMKTIEDPGERKSILGAQQRQRWRERGEMAPPGPDAAGGGDDMEDRINAPKSQWPYATGRRSALRGG